MIVTPFTWLDSSLALLLPDVLRIFFWAVLSGIASMAVYAWTSPQQRLRDLKVQTTELQKQLAAYDGDFAGAMAITRQNLTLALARLGWALVPSLLAGLPVVLVLVGMFEVYTGTQVLSFGPTWLRSWLATYFIVLTFAALGTKLACHIE
jgi:hypothetical protein